MKIFSLSTIFRSPTFQGDFRIVCDNDPDPLDDDKQINDLYQNGVIDYEAGDLSAPYMKFACPFVQNDSLIIFPNELFRYMGKLHEPFEEMSDVYTPVGLNIQGLAMRFQTHLRKNRDWLLEDAAESL
ncbi:MAG: hypothetical protein GY801_52005 [bacterium]|nr:hypothetical protein [bacterium]